MTGVVQDTSHLIRLLIVLQFDVSEEHSISLLSGIVLIVSWPTTSMLAHIMLYSLFFPIASSVTSGNISYLLDRSEVHTLTPMFLLATFKVVSYAVINNLVTIFYLVFDSVSFCLFTLIVKQVNYLLSSVFHGGSPRARW